MKEFTLEGFAAFIAGAGMAEGIAKAQRHALEKAAQVIETEAKRVIGTYDYGWPPLKPATIAQKTTGDSPLLETGEMRDSIEHKVVSHDLAYVGSDNDKAVWHELGTATVPARSFLGAAAAGAAHEVCDIVGVAVGAALASRSVDAALVELLIHAAKKIKHDVAEAFAETDHRQDRDR